MNHFIEFRAYNPHFQTVSTDFRLKTVRIRLAAVGGGLTGRLAST